MTPTHKLPVIICSGQTPTEVGLSHGTQLRSRIGATLQFYFQCFEALGLSLDEVRLWGECFRGEIGAFVPDLAEEIEGIANGAGRASWELFALNARSEILARGRSRASAATPAECTAVYCPASALLAQNWDWDVRIDALPVLLQIPGRGPSPRILTMTEPGMVAKVGLNACGLGVCLNMLAGPHPGAVPSGVPVHCLLRIALSCKTLQQAEALLSAPPRDCACHIFLADAIGQFRMLEFAGAELECAGSDPLSRNMGDEFPIEGSEWQVVPPTLVAHTNHYLHPRFEALPCEIAHTKERYRRVLEIADEHDDAGNRTGAEEQLRFVKRVLGDRTGAPKSILYEEAPGIIPGASAIATICSIIMDLRSNRIHITRGSALAQDYMQVPLLEATL